MVTSSAHPASAHPAAANPTAPLAGTGLPTGEDSVRIPLLGLGTWPMTGSECTDAVLTALEAGYRHVDTAENYRNEDAVGRAVVASGIPRREVFVTSKFNKEWHGPVETVRTALEAALERAGLDYLDLYLVHWPNPGQGRHVQACESLAELMDTGLIRSWGVSNFTPAHLEAVLTAGLVPAVHQFHCQPVYAQPAVQEATAAAGVLSAAYSPLGRGGELLRLGPITRIAGRLGRTPAQVVLRWHLQHGRVGLPKSADARRQRENLDVTTFELTAEDMAAVDGLDSVTPPDTFLDAESFGH